MTVPTVQAQEIAESISIDFDPDLAGRILQWWRHSGFSVQWAPIVETEAKELKAELQKLGLW